MLASVLFYIFFYLLLRVLKRAIYLRLLLALLGSCSRTDLLSSKSMCYVCGGESGATLESALLVLWLPSRAYSSTSPNLAARFRSRSRPNSTWIPSFKIYKACLIDGSKDSKLSAAAIYKIGERNRIKYATNWNLGPYMEIIDIELYAVYKALEYLK